VKLDYVAIENLIDENEARDITLRASSLVLLFSAMASLDHPGNWASDGEPLSVAELDDVENWVALAYRDLMEEIEAGGNGMQYAVLQQRYAQGLNGGSSSNGTWNEREVTTTLPDSANLATVTDGEFQLIEGDFHVNVTARTYQTGRNRLRLYNVTADEVLEVGEVTEADSVATLDVFVTTHGSDWFRVDHWTAQGNSGDGLGRRLDKAGYEEVYMSVRITKLD